MENDSVSMDIQVNTQVNDKGVDKVATGMSNIATNASQAEKNVQDLSKSVKDLGSFLKLLNGKIKPGIDLTEVEKALAQIEKGIDQSLDKVIPLFAEKMAKEASSAHNLRTSEGLLAKANAIRARPREEYYEQQHLERLNRRNQGNRIDSELAILMGRATRDKYYQQQHNERYSNWVALRRDTDPRYAQHQFDQAVQSRISRGYEEKAKFQEEQKLGAAFSFMEKELDDFRKQLAGINVVLKSTGSGQAKDKFYDAQHKERVRGRYEQGEHLYRQNQWLLSQGKAPITEVMGANGEMQSAEELIGYYQQIQAEIKERADLQKRLKEQAKKEEKIVSANDNDVANAEDEILQAKEEEAEAAKQSAKTEKKAAKEMTEFQKKKIKVAEETNESYDRRTEVFRQSEERKNQLQLETANSRAFRNAHPELFARGGQYHDSRYQTGNALTNVGNKLGQLGAGGKLVGDILGTVGAFVKGFPAGVATAVTKLASGILDLGKAATQAFSEIESIKTQLGVVFSNQTQAEGMFGQISEYAIHSPFGVQQTSELAVLLKQSGVYASDLMDTLKMLGDTAGGNMEKMKRIANNYAQIVSIGKASMLDMRQFAYAGIPIFEAVSKELNVSQQELRKMISDGKVTSDIIEKVFKDLTGINGIFENATEKGAKTLKARLQNLADAKQLALSSVGEGIVNAGSTYGKDSAMLGIVERAEGFFSWVREHMDVKNIERDVKLIASSNSRVEALEKALEDARKRGDKDLEKVIKTELEYQKNVYDIEKQRQVYSDSYDVKNAAKDRFVEMFGDMSPDRIQKEISSYVNKMRRANTLTDSGWDAENQKALTDQEMEFYRAQADVYAQLIYELEEYKKAVTTATKTTEEEVRANRERNLINEQQEAYDRMNRYSDSASSLMTSFRDLEEIYKSSDEYKEKQEEERKKRLIEALDILKEIEKNTSENGYVDLTKLSSAQLRDYNKRGAFSAAKKLDVAPKNGKYSAEDRTQLTNQYGYFEELVAGYIEKLGPKFSNQLKAVTTNGLSSIIEASDAEFYKKFSVIENNMKKALESVRNNAPAQQVVNDMNAFLEDMPYYLLGVQSGTGTGATVDMINEANNEFIAFWKRIMSENTGLTTQNMTSPEAALNDYMSDIANRTTVANVMKAALSTMGVSSAVSLLKARDTLDEKTLKNAGFSTYQVDWEKSAKAVKEFATQLSASTEVISAYREGLEEQADVLKNIIVSSTKFESADLKQNNKIVSVKTLGKYAYTEGGSQLVNALGRDLSYEGHNVSYDAERDAFIADGIGELSDEMLQNLTIDDDIYKLISDYLPKIQKEISETKMRERNNQELADIVTTVLPTVLAKGLMDSSNPGLSSFFLGNKGYAVDQFNNAFDSVIQDFKSAGMYTELTGKTKEDILVSALDEKAEYHDQAVLVVQEIMEAIRRSAGELGVNGGAYGSLFGLSQTTDRDTAMLERYNKLFGSYNGQLSPNAWKDEGGYSLGTKFIGDLFGFQKGYTMQDLYNQGAMEGLTKSTIYWREALEDTLDVMKSLGEEMISITGEMGKKAWLTPFEQWGKILINGKNWTEETADAYKELGTEALNALGPVMARAGFELVARGALSNNWALILGGLGLAAAGGFASGLGGALSEAQAESDNDKETEKLQDLKDQLADLLEQARTDALYYENNLRHQTALGLNREFSYKSVHDAVITPQGDVVTTDPKDYLIATKTPQNLVGGGSVTVSPVINCNVVNNTSAQVRQEQTQNADGSIDIVTIIEEVAGGYIASSRSDDAFNARSYRMNGRQSVM